jgi:hypothetical protein
MPVAVHGLRGLLATCVAAGALTFAGDALAQDGDEALDLFRQGRSLGAQGDYAGACAKFEASYAIQPRLASLLNLGDCNEHLGRTATAWKHFVEAAGMARQSNDDERARYATQHAATLEARLPRMVLRGLTGSADARVSVDGSPVAAGGAEIVVPLDPGDHVVQVDAPGRAAWTKSFHLGDGPESKVLTLPQPEAPQPPQQPVVPPVPPPERGMRPQRVAAIGVGGLGVASIATGAAFGLFARSQWNDAVSNHCPALPTCDSTGVREAGDAKQAALVSTITFGAGLAALGAAAALWWTAPPAGRTTAGPGAVLSPAIDPHGPGFVVRGAF